MQHDALPDWAIFQRLELNMLFISRVQVLSDMLIKQHALQKANEWLLKGLEIDPFSEQLAKGLIKLYLQLERKNDAKVFYKTFRERLISEMDIEPSTVLQRLIATV